MNSYQWRRELLAHAFEGVDLSRRESDLLDGLAEWLGDAIPVLARLTIEARLVSAGCTCPIHDPSFPVHDQSCPLYDPDDDQDEAATR